MWHYISVSMYQAPVQFMWLGCVGRVSAITFRVMITIKIGVRVYTTLPAMQSLHALDNLCVCTWMYVLV